MENHDIQPYEIEQEYQVGDTVWYLEGNEARRGTVSEAIDTDGGYEYAVIDEDGDMVTLDNFEVYPVAESLARAIFANYFPDDIDLDLQR